MHHRKLRLIYEEKQINSVKRISFEKEVIARPLIYPFNIYRLFPTTPNINFFVFFRLVDSKQRLTNYRCCYL